MVRGLKKKLLIGLLSAAVVGTSLAPSVPLVGSFAQEVKAEDEAPASTLYKYTEVKVTAKEIKAATAKSWSPEKKDTWKHVTEKDGDLVITDLGATPGENESTTDIYDCDTEAEGYPSNPTTLEAISNFKVSNAVVEAEPAVVAWDTQFEENKYYASKDDTALPMTKEQWDTKFGASPNDGASDVVYTREKDTTKSSITVDKAKDTASSVTSKSIGSTNGGSATIDKNKPTKITVDIAASEGKVVKSVVAKIINAATNKQIGSDITATKVDGTENTYELLVTATEDTVKVLISTEEDDLLITPKLSSTLSSKVGTAELTSTAAVKPGKKIELKVTLAEGATKDNVTVKAAGKVINGSDPDDGVVTYSIDTTDVKDEELEIEVSGRLDNDGLDKTKTDKGSTATVVNAGDAAADANDVLDVAKSDQDGKYVNAKLNISTSDDTGTGALKSEVALAEKSGLKLAGYISIDFLRTVSDTPIGANAQAPTESVTKLGAPLAVKYFLPKAAIGKTGYKAIRFHDTIGEITTTPNADGEYIEVKGNELILHVKLLSDFAVVYNDTDATPEVPDPVKPDDNKPSEEVTPSSGTTATTSTTTATTSTTKAAKATTSTKKSSKTSSPKTADYAVNSLLALLTGAAGLFGITLINKKRKEDEE